MGMQKAGGRSIPSPLSARIINRKMKSWFRILICVNFIIIFFQEDARCEPPRHPAVPVSKK